jgi:hypothetical protein
MPQLNKQAVIGSIDDKANLTANGLRVVRFPIQQQRFTIMHLKILFFLYKKTENDVF